MAFSERYERQVRLLLRVIPLVAEEPCFALKGGTAIHLFYRNLLRLSVDLDLTYLPVAPRGPSLAGIHEAMVRTAGRIERALRGARVMQVLLAGEASVVKLLVRDEGAQIKIEVTPVLRGCVYPSTLRELSPAVQDRYGFAAMQVVSFADLYAGKLVAALDRQHPRDLFDVRDLLDGEGIGEELRRAFVVYLLSHHRPLVEILNPKRKPLGVEYLRGFVGMTATPVSLADLEETRERMIRELVQGMPNEHRAFLISYERGEPAWELLDIREVWKLPAVQWRTENLNRLSGDKRRKLVKSLEALLLEPRRRRAGSE